MYFDPLNNQRRQATSGCRRLYDTRHAKLNIVEHREIFVSRALVLNSSKPDGPSRSLVISISFLSFSFFFLTQTLRCNLRLETLRNLEVLRFMAGARDFL